MAHLQYFSRFRKALRSLEILEAREMWPRKQIEAYQLDRLNTVWRHAISHVPYYRNMAAECGAPYVFSTIEEFRNAVPVLSKDVVMENCKAFLSEKKEPGAWQRTGGSTGTPMSIYWGAEAYREMLRAQYRLHAAWGVSIFDSWAYLWGHSASFAPGLGGYIARIRQPLEDMIRRRLRLSAYRLGRSDLQKYLKRIEVFRPVAIYGYGSALALLAREAEAIGFRCDSIRLIVLSGEPAFPHLVDTIEKAFKVPAVAEYGSHECGITATEWRDRTLRVREDLTLAETLPRKDGRFDIILTCLNNPSFPLLRYDIGDMTDAPLEIPDYGFAILKNVAGRNNDMIISRSGNILHSARFDALFKYENRMIRRFQMNQDADGSISAMVELHDPRTKIDTRGLTAKIQELAEGFPVRVRVVEAIPPSAAGKHRTVVSALTGVESLQINSGGDRGVVVPPPEKAEKGDSAVEASFVAVGSSHIIRGSEPAPTKAARLRQLIESPKLVFLMEAHNGLSAKIVQEAGFEGIWGSGLSISAALGVRDCNEASWTQVLEMLEFMSDATRIPILADGDSGYGNYNNVRRLVRKLEQSDIAGVCIEDKLFPKMNSFLSADEQVLADIDEFCGRITAGKETQRSSDFVIVARIEALIAGLGLREALIRGEAYRNAGADAILIHSSRNVADEVVEFKAEWGDRLPVIIVPTKYYRTPTEVFQKQGFSAVIWANHLMRCCIPAMRATARRIFEDQSLANVENEVATLSEVFQLQGLPELKEAEKRYLPIHTKIGPVDSHG